MIRRPPSSTRPDPLLPYTPLFRSAAMLLATVIWSVVAAPTFALARRMQAYDYRAFFEGLLGPGWIAFEIAYLIFVVLILARSEEHTSELQSLMRISYAVFCLKKKHTLNTSTYN